MPEIMIRCPTFGTAVPTGLTTEAIKFGLSATPGGKWRAQIFVDGRLFDLGGYGFETDALSLTITTPLTISVSSPA